MRRRRRPRHRWKGAVMVSEGQKSAPLFVPNDRPTGGADPESGPASSRRSRRSSSTSTKQQHQQRQHQCRRARTKVSLAAAPQLDSIQRRRTLHHTHTHRTSGGPCCGRSQSQSQNKGVGRRGVWRRETVAAGWRDNCLGGGGACASRAVEQSNSTTDGPASTVCAGINSQ